MDVTNTIATGFSCQPLADGTVRMEFHYGDQTINSQVVSADAFRHLPMVAEMTLAVMEQGDIYPVTDSN